MASDQLKTAAVQAAVIDSHKEFVALARRLKTSKRIALDTEAASYHKYFDRIYLIQISTESETAVVDPLTIEDPSALGDLLANPKIELVFHDADYDLRVLQRDYDFEGRNLFDTRIAAQLLGEPGVGLGSLLGKYFDIHLDKRMQRADWSRRPLTAEMIEYAAGDTHHLLGLRDKLEMQLQEAGRLHWAQEEFGRLEGLKWTQPNQDGNGFLRIKGAKALRPQAMAILRELHEWREKKAAQLDRAPFRVLGNDALLILARAAPTQPSSLGRLKGVPVSVARRHGDELIAAITAGLAVPPDRCPRAERPQRPKPNPEADARFDTLKKVRNRMARTLELEPGVLCPNGTLQAIARAAPTDSAQLLDIEDLRRWQIEAMGEKVIMAAVSNGNSS